MPYQQRIVCFVLLACAVSWAIWAPLLIGMSPDVFSHPLYYGGVLGPALAAIVTSRLQGSASVAGLLQRATNWRIPMRWYLLALLLPVAVRLGAILIFIAAKGRAPIAFRSWETFLPFAVLILPLVYLEEVGWRGYALPQLQRRHSPLFASLLVGVIWGVWHFPLAWASVGFQRSDEPVAYMFRFIVTILPISCVATWLFNHASESVVIASVYHFSVNMTESLFVMPSVVGNALLWVSMVLNTVVVFVLWRFNTKDAVMAGA